MRAELYHKRYYRLVDTRRVGSQVHQLVKFRIPQVSKAMRRKIIEWLFYKSEAVALAECYWAKGSIIWKNQWDFDVILIFDRLPPSPWSTFEGTDKRNIELSKPGDVPSLHLDILQSG